MKRDDDGNIPRKNGFTQVAICMALLVKNTSKGIKEFEAQFQEHFGIEAQFLETVVTAPDQDDQGFPVPETGGRTDVFIALKAEDACGSFAVQRLAMGIRWLEDAIAPGNGGGRLYPQRVGHYTSWEA